MNSQTQRIYMQRVRNAMSQKIIFSLSVFAFYPRTEITIYELKG